MHWIRRVIVRSKSHPATRQWGKHENNWARHPSRSVTPLSCGEYLCWVQRRHAVCALVYLILVVKILGGEGTSSEDWYPLVLEMTLPSRKTS
jgi:hypothetical protein